MDMRNPNMIHNDSRKISMEIIILPSISLEKY